MAQRAPVHPIQQRPRIIRTPYGWDCKMEDEASVIPAWDEPEDSGPKRKLLTWALVPVAIAVVVLVVFHPLLGAQAPVATQHPPAIPVPTEQTSQAPATAAATPTAGATPNANNMPPPTPTASPGLEGGGTMPPPTPTVAPAPAAVDVTGQLPAGFTGVATCNNNGRAGSNPPQCQFGVTTAAGTTVTYTLSWPEATALRLTVYGPPPTSVKLGTATSSSGTITLTIPNNLAQTVVIVSGGAGAATFDLRSSMG